MSSFRGSTAIVGAGMTPLARRSGRSILSLAREACSNALDSAGLAPSEVDGIVEYSIYNDSVAAEAVGASLGAGDLSYVMDFAQGGQAASIMVAHAGMAVASGLASTVLVFRA